ncbi:MAG TPA: tRNA epoxyqueuosine(34) reductase QueG [Armatimonadota bacterium]|nr:tRNA epoxyqueuosine(34) reductase QueG [Armatimonadota bacterium]
MPSPRGLADAPRPPVEYNGPVNIAAETAWMLRRAGELGFAAAGIAAVEPMDPAPLRAWLAAGYHAEMAFLARHLPLRADLRRLLPAARSVIVTALAYPAPNVHEPVADCLARYARGRDYHDVVAEMLTRLWAEIRARHPDAAGRVFVDGGPLPERELARRAGIGWPGRHGCLIHPTLGTRFVLGEILTTLPLAPSEPAAGACGSCRRCADACPTGAIVAPGVLDARRCISYLTIEHKGGIPAALRPLIGGRLFGCDACQDACPHNRGMGEPAPAPRDALLALLALTPEEFHRRFQGTPLRRAKRRGLLRNVCVVLGNLGGPDALPALRRALDDAEPLVREHAAWAIAHIRERG